MFSKAQISFPWLVLIFLVGSCSPVPTLPSPTPVPPQPSNTAPAIFSPFQSGTRYADSAGDIAIPFLDVVAFRANVNDETETLDVTLWLRDIPEMADHQKSADRIEYSWKVDVFLNPSSTGPADYRVGFSTLLEDPAASGTSLTPIPGQPELVPMHQLLLNNHVYDTNGQPIESVQGQINPDRNTLFFTGHVPGITSDAVFSFEMSYQEEMTDRPDNYVPPESTNRATPIPEVTLSATESATRLVPTGTVRAYPGPEQYAGDILTFEIKVPSDFDGSLPIYMALDNGPPIIAPESVYYGHMVLPSALDTTNLEGRHTLTFTTENGALNETYSFHVLPKEQRPEDEVRADWLLRETDCCIFHYLSGTAAARDIDFISEHFQQGADKYEAFMKAEVDSKMEIYIMDRMWGNGGYGGSGHIVISYTDRYYGPTVDGSGLEVLARHEFSHAASISPENAGSAIDFDYEGLSVYVAGGHYKPEPLAQRGAAFYDLGFSAPVNERIPQHELSYLHAALMLTYVADTYGKDRVWELLRADPDPSFDPILPIEDAIRLTFGISSEEFDQGFQAWLESNDPGEQLDDLRLTVTLQDARREYQDHFSPDPLFLGAHVDPGAITRPEYMSIVMRESHAPANIAIELMIANAQQAIVDAEYAEAENLIQSIKEVISTGDFEDPLAKEYLDIVLVAARDGYEVVDLHIQGEHAESHVTLEPPNLISLKLEKIDGVWHIRR